MSSRPLPGTFFQIGYVVPNLDTGLAHLNAKLGAPRFMVFREIVVENGWSAAVPPPSITAWRSAMSVTSSSK